MRFNASSKGREDNIKKNIGYLWNPKMIYYVAAKDHMHYGIIKDHVLCWRYYWVVLPLCKMER
jgi:hypothetical protein